MYACTYKHTYMRETERKTEMEKDTHTHTSHCESGLAHMGCWQASGREKFNVGFSACGGAGFKEVPGALDNTPCLQMEKLRPTIRK